MWSELKCDRSAWPMQTLQAMTEKQKYRNRKTRKMKMIFHRKKCWWKMKERQRINSFNTSIQCHFRLTFFLDFVSFRRFFLFSTFFVLLFGTLDDHSSVVWQMTTDFSRFCFLLKLLNLCRTTSIKLNKENFQYFLSFFLVKLILQLVEEKKVSFEIIQQF